MTVTLYVFAVVLGQALGYAAVRLFVWAWPSPWALMWGGGRKEYRDIYEGILSVAPHHSRWRAAFYAFLNVGEMDRYRKRKAA